MARAGTADGNKPAVLRCLVMPLSPGFALLPSVLIQALLYNEDVTGPADGAPPWLLGSVYREATGVVPLVSLEVLCDLPASPSGAGHIALLRHVSIHDGTAFFAVKLSAAPWVVEVDSASILRSSATDSVASCVASRISLQGREGFIPDLDAIGSLVASLPQTTISPQR